MHASSAVVGVAGVAGVTSTATGSRPTGTADRTMFIGPRLSQVVKSMLKSIKRIDQNLFRRLLQVIVFDLEGDQKQAATAYEKISEEITDKETTVILFAGLYELLRKAFQIPLSSFKQKVFQEDLQQMQFPDQFIPDMVNVVFGKRREAIDVQNLKSRPRPLNLESLRWRVDVGISTNVLNRVLEPTVTMQMTLSDGQIQDFEVSVEVFEKLRYNVACVLKDMEDLEKRTAFKIHD